MTMWSGVLQGLVLVPLLIPHVTAQLGLNEERAEMERTVDCNAACSHRSRGPVCGTNGRTYRNLCDLDNDICRKVKVALKHEGECSLAEKCLDERAARQEQVANGENVYVPACLADGSYAPVQCHNFTLFCWCSRLDGKPIPETIQYDSSPDCPERTKDPPQTSSTSSGPGKLSQEDDGPAGEESLDTLLSLSTATPAGPPTRRKPPVNKKCARKARRTFIDELSKRLLEEYKRSRNTRGVSERRLLKRALKAKFSRLDRNRDRKLRRREYKRLKKTVRKFIKPKKCAKMFPRLCDANGDRSLTEREWVTCFTQPSRTSRNNSDRCNRPPCRNRPTTPKPSVPSCERTRKMALEAEHSSNISIPVLTCQPDGKYEAVQCLKDICICVDEWTGNSLDGTGVKNGTPDCSRPLPHARIWIGCVGEDKTKFMQGLNKFLQSKVEGDRSASADSATQSVEDLARYHFNSLDQDSSGYLEGREKKMVKRLFKMNRNLRKCGRKITTYCDVNYDKRVSLEEWVACVTMQQNDTDETPQRPDPKNPFETILKPEV